MLRIHIVRNRQPIGEFTSNEVAEGLKSGQFLATDLGWREPMDHWVALAEFPHLPQEKPDEVELPPPLPENVQPSADGPAWERRKELGIWKGLTQTVRQVFLTPSTTFQAMKAKGGYLAPFAFFFILSVVGNWISLAYQISVVALGYVPLPSSAGVSPTGMMVAMIFGGLIFVPAILAGIAFVMSGIFHLLLHAVGGSTNGYEATFRAYCYSFGAASIMLLIPFVGMYITLGMGIGFLVIALRALHGISTLRALSVVVPLSIAWVGLYLAFTKAMMAASGL